MPNSLSNVLKNSFVAFKNNFLALFVVNGIFFAISYVLPLIIVPSISSINTYNVNGMLFFLFPLLFAITIGLLFLMPIYFGANAYIVMNYSETGEKSKIRDAFKAGLKAYSNYLLTGLSLIPFLLVLGIIIGIIIAITVFITMFCAAFSGAFNNEFLGGNFGNVIYNFFGVAIFIALISQIIFGFFAFITIFCRYIPLTENKSGFKAIVTSFAYIFKGDFWRNLGHGIMYLIITAAIVIVPLIIVFISFVFNTFNADMYSAYTVNNYIVFTTAASIIVGIVTLILAIFSTCYFYQMYLNAKFDYELKITKEKSSTIQG